MNFETVCRLCLEPDYNQMNIFSCPELEIPEIISRHFWFHVTPSDEESQSICNDCWNSLKSFDSFYKMVEEAQQSLTNDQSCLLKIEPVTEGMDCTNLCSITTEKLSESEEPDENIFIAEHLDVNVSIKSDCTKDVFVIDNNSDNEENHDNADSKEDNIDEVRTQNQPSANDIKFECEICGEVCSSFAMLKRHFTKASHKMHAYIKCCGTKIYKKKDILKHISTHPNKSDFSCIKCTESFTSQRGLKLHTINKHKNEKDQKFKCSICGKGFAMLHVKEKHERLHTTDSDGYSCGICSFRFTTQRAVNAHEKYAHTSTSSCCEICGKTFSNIYNYRIHLRTVHADSESMVKCDICGILLKHAENLRQHKLRSHATETKSCHICGKVTPNQNALATHIRRHNKQSYQCPLCDKTFFASLLLKEHVATHTGVHLYTCPYCPKTFKSNANLHSHRKKAHFELWARDRGKKMQSTLKPNE